MSDDPCPLCSADAPTRRALLAVQGEALDWSTRLSSIEYSERWARDAAVDADDVGLDDIAAKLRGCESGLALGGDAIRALIRIRAWLAEVEAERDAARLEADAFTAYRSLVTTALGIDPASCADDVREAIEVLKAAVRFADEQGAEAIARVAANIVADKWAATAAFQAQAIKAEAEVVRLRADLEETRLTRAAMIAADKATT